jgi:hypothetical protein
MVKPAETMERWSLPARTHLKLWMFGGRTTLIRIVMTGTCVSQPTSAFDVTWSIMNSLCNVSHSST